MRIRWERTSGRRHRRAAPLAPESMRVLVATVIGVLIWTIWITGMLGDSHRVTMLALSAVSILGLGLVLELRRRCVAETALRQAKEEADLANRSKTQFLATMSHELRTPLNGIIGFSEIMQSGVMGPVGNVKYQSYIEDIHACGTHLLQLINDILDLTRAEVGRFDLCEDTIDVAEVINSVARLSEADLERARLTVAVDVAPDLPDLRADQRKTRQVLFNLIGNAVKFTPEGGHITISGRVNPEAEIEITVTDTGIGIARQDLSRVLEPFVQVGNPRHRNHHSGTGLGLPAVKALMELHGGTFELSSVLGAGTRASVTFPPERTVERSPPVLALPAA
jgi:ammonium transporter, Amt family